MPQTFQLRRGTAAEWAFANPILQAGEMGYETSTNRLKIGNGIDPWSSLAYAEVSELDWSNIQNTPASFPPDTSNQGFQDYVSQSVGSHSASTTSVHGIADTSQIIVEGDSRLTDARVPTEHGHDISDVEGLQAALDAKAATAALATVAATGSYNDLSDLPALGTASATDSTDYATAAQGNLADSAVQPGDLAAVATSGSYSDLSGTPSNLTPTSHASTHASGGSDPISPEDIGAAPAADPDLTGTVDVDGSIVVSTGSTFPGPGVTISKFGVGIGASPSLAAVLTVNGHISQVSASDPGFGGRLTTQEVRIKDSTRRISAGATGFFYSADQHLFRNNAATATFLTLDGTKTLVGGDLEVTGSLDAPHAATHATGGADAIAPSDIGAAPAASPTFTGVITVSAGSAAAPAIVASGDSNTGLAFPAADTFAVSTAGVERVRVDASGQVGIGLADPLAPLNVIAADSGAAAACQQWGYNSFNNAGYNLKLRTGVTSGVVRWVFDQTNDSTDYSNVLVIDRGNVGIGTADPASALDINADTMRLRTAKTPASSSDTGNAGDICWDASYLYICTATNNWRRIAHSTW